MPAWAHGWDNSVSTSKMATVWAEPPIADVDGDGRLEMVLSMFNAEAEPRWMVRIYDAVTGELKAKVMDRIAAEVADLDGDGVAGDPGRHLQRSDAGRDRRCRAAQTRQGACVAGVHGRVARRRLAFRASGARSPGSGRWSAPARPRIAG